MQCTREEMNREGFILPIELCARSFGDANSVLVFDSVRGVFLILKSENFVLRIQGNIPKRCVNRKSKSES